MKNINVVKNNMEEPYLTNCRIDENINEVKINMKECYLKKLFKRGQKYPSVIYLTVYYNLFYVYCLLVHH